MSRQQSTTFEEVTPQVHGQSMNTALNMIHTPNFGTETLGMSDALLSDLVIDRDEQDGEIFEANSWYGNAKVIRDYTGWSLPLPFVVPHGIALSNAVWEAEVKSGLPIYAFPEHLTPEYQKLTHRKVFRGTSPWLYLQELRKSSASSQPVGTLAFPSHSSHRVTSDMADEEYAEKLRSLPLEMHPVRICMYWRDIQLGRHHLYRKAGLPVVTAGHMYDDKFLGRLYDLLSCAKFLHTPALGSHVFYGAALGLQVFFDDSFSVIERASQEVLASDSPALNSELVAEVTKIFRQPAASGRQKEYALEILGRRHMVSPRELRALLRRSAMSNPLYIKLILKRAIRKKYRLG